MSDSCLLKAFFLSDVCIIAIQSVLYKLLTRKTRGFGIDILDVGFFF